MTCACGGPAGRSPALVRGYPASKADGGPWCLDCSLRLAQEMVDRSKPEQGRLL